MTENIIQYFSEEQIQEIKNAEYSGLKRAGWYFLGDSSDFFFFGPYDTEDKAKQHYRSFLENDEQISQH